MEKTYVFDSGGSENTCGLLNSIIPALQNRGVDTAALLAAMGNNNGGLFGGRGFEDIIALIIVAAIFGNGNFGFGNNGNHCGNSTEREMIMSAIQRNGVDLNSLASTLHCSVSDLQNGINNVATQICNLSAQNGQNSMQIINAIQSGNQALSTQIAQCCCDLRESVTRMGYDNQLATLKQTETLAGKIDAQTVTINDKFCQLEKRELQNRIDALREENSTYKTSAMTSQIVASATAPISAVVNDLSTRLGQIECKIPSTVSVPANNGVYIPACAAAQLGLYGGLGAGLGYLNNAYPYGAAGYGCGCNNSLWG